MILPTLPRSPKLLLTISVLCLAQAVRTAATPSPGCLTNSSPTAGSWDSNTAFDEGIYSHKYSYPSNSGASNPPPLLLWFHGYGGGSDSCGSTCSAADERGYATISLTGIAGNGESNSWNGFGSNQSNTGASSIEAQTAGSDNCNLSSEDDRTCNTNAYNIDCYADCNEECTDKCWWTTCKDSVQQTVNVLEDFLNDYCVDMDRIYAAGCSNGGMFTYELANDERSAKYLAGISTQVGLPHYGFNNGPNSNFKIHHLGFWGSRDTIVPPKENASSNSCTVPCRTSERNGWFYTSSECTMDKWADELGLTNVEINPSTYGISSYPRELPECVSYTGSEDDTIVVGCIFKGGHVCNQDYMNDVTLNFFDAHPTPPVASSPTGSPTSSPTESSPGPSPCTNRFDTPPSGSDCNVDCCNKKGCWTSGGRAGQCR